MLNEIFRNNYININFNIDPEKMNYYDNLYDEIINICKGNITTDFFNDIEESFIYESEEPLNESQTQIIFEYLVNNPYPNIHDLFILFKDKSNYFRDDFIGIQPNPISNDKISWKHAGIHPNNIDYNELQNFVNLFYDFIYNNNYSQCTK